jgi:hypothetical protein
MAEETITRLIDDIDGTEATQKVLVGLNGEWRAIDLNDKNADRLLKNLNEFWDAASPVRGAGASKPRSATAAKAKAKAARSYDIAMLREWAAEKKIDIPARGRIAGTTVERFQADVKNGWKPSAG